MARSIRPLYPEIEGAIVLHVIEHDEATATELKDALGDKPTYIGEALIRLRDRGLLHLDGETATPTDCLRYFDMLGLLNVTADS